MAETSGFFDSVWDDTKYNEETGTYGDWNPRYLVDDFNNYFALFISNGVFAVPENQCKVVPGTGSSVVVLPGWAYINGRWYHNDAEKVIQVPVNASDENRVDSIKIRSNDSDGKILALFFENDTDLVRTESIYDLKIAEITVPPYSVSILEGNISDTRTDSSVCGYVSNILGSQGESGIQTQIGDLEDLTTVVKSNLVSAINEVKSGVNALQLAMSGNKAIVFATQEPTSVPDNTIVFVYEE